MSAENRVVIINRKISSLSNSSALAGIHPGEWFLVEDINTLYWKHPITKMIGILAKSGTGGVINTTFNNLSNIADLNTVQKGEWFFVQSEKKFYWRNPTTNLIEQMESINISQAKQLLSTTLIEIDTQIASYFYTVPLVKNATFAPINLTTTENSVTSFILEITNGGNFTIGWWANLKWKEGSPPALPLNKTTVLQFYGIKKNKLDPYIWYGSILSQNII